MLGSAILLAVTVLAFAAAAAIVLFPLQIVSALTSRKGYGIRANVAYGKHSRQRLDIYTPVNVAVDAPVVVFFHGGSWDKGENDSYRFVGQALATGGAIVVIPDYRLWPEVVFPEFVRDGALAVAWTIRNLGDDGGSPRPLFIAGHSAGAHIAALLNLDPRYLEEASVDRGRIAGAIGLSGPYDFLPLKERYKRVFPEAVRDAGQPINFVDGSAPPMLLIVGDADTTVNPGNTIRLAAAIEAKSGQVSTKVHRRVSHIGPLIALAEILPYRKPPVRREMLAFIREQSARR